MTARLPQYAPTKCANGELRLPKGMKPMIRYLRQMALFAALCLLFALSNVHCASTDDGPKEVVEATQDAGEPPEPQAPEPVAETPSPILSLPCDQLKDSWLAFTKKHKSCQTKKDCFITGVTGMSCDCIYYIYSNNGHALSTTAKPEADLYMQRMMICKDEQKGFGCNYDYPLLEEFDCIEGTCQITEKPRRCF